MVSKQSKEDKKWCLWLSLRENQFEYLISTYFSVFLFLNVSFLFIRASLVESKIRLLVKQLERHWHISMAHVNQQSHTGPTEANDK